MMPQHDGLERRKRRHLLCVAGLLLASLLPAPAVAAETAQDAASARPLASTLQRYVDEQIVAGMVVLVADRERVLDLEAIGWADLEAKKPMQPDDLFWIASMSKTVTAAAFMMLVDEGRVNLDDPVEKYIPEFKNIKIAQPDGTLAAPVHPPRIREILSHTSGMGFLNKTDKQVIDSVPLQTSVEHSLLDPLQFQPGTKYGYSNEGIDAAGRIIEIVSGMPYEKFLQDRLFTPLGMTDTTFWPTPAQLRRLAKTYKPTDDGKGLEETKTRFLTHPLDGPNRYPAPGGGLFSTARDVCRFCQMLANGGSFEGRKYLSAEAVRTMTTKQTGDLDDNYGFGVSASRDGRSFGHGGALKTSMSVDNGRVFLFLVQYQGKWPEGKDPNGAFGAHARRLYGQSASAAPAIEGSQPPAGR